VLAVMMAEEGFYAASQQHPALLPVYRFPEAAAGALAQLCAYADWRRRAPEGRPPELAADDARVERLLADREAGYLPVAAALELMDAYGIPVARWQHVKRSAEVPAAASELGYPVVLQATGAALLHKSELGAVAVDLRDDSELAAALAAMTARLATA